MSNKNEEQYVLEYLMYWKKDDERASLISETEVYPDAVTLTDADLIVSLMTASFEFYAQAIRDSIRDKVNESVETVPEVEGHLANLEQLNKELDIMKKLQSSVEVLFEFTQS
jgi:hypothetical protein